MQPREPDEQELLVGIMQKFCRTRRKDDLVREAQARNAGWAPVYSPREIVESDQLDARDYWVQVRHEDIGETFVYPGAPFKLAGTPWRQRGRAPRVGEHSEEVYGDVLGLDPDDIVKLRRTMVI